MTKNAIKEFIKKLHENSNSEIYRELRKKREVEEKKFQEKDKKRAQKCAYCGIVTEEGRYHKGNFYCMNCWQLIITNENLYGNSIVVIT